MGRRLLLLNLLMVTAIVLLAQHLVASWSDFASEPRVFGPDGPPPPAPQFGEPEGTSSLGDFLVITERNLFSANRGQELPEEMEPEEEEAPEFTRIPELISLSAIRGEKQAVLTIFSGRRGRESENRTVKLGDDVEGYEVSEIGRDHLILQWKHIEEMIELNPTTNAAESRPSSARQPIRIITVGAAMAAVETVQAADAEETERGLQVGSVGSTNQAGVGRRGGTGGVNQGGGGNRGGRGGLAGRGQSNTRNNNSLPGTVGVGGRRPVPNQPPR